MNFRLLKALVFGALGLIGFVVLLSFFIPSQVHVVRNGMVNVATTNQLHYCITHMPEWQKWHPALHSDSVQALTATASMLIVKKGSQQITLKRLAITDTSCLVEMRIPGEPLFLHEIYWQKMPAGSDSTAGNSVVWHATAKLQWYPWQKFYGIFLDKITAPGYEQALASLNQYLSAKQ
jgi:hypothetical protein